MYILYYYGLKRNLACAHVLPYSDFEPLPLFNHLHVTGWGWPIWPAYPVLFNTPQNCLLVSYPVPALCRHCNDRCLHPALWDQPEHPTGTAHGTQGLPGWTGVWAVWSGEDRSSQQQEYWPCSCCHCHCNWCQREGHTRQKDLPTVPASGQKKEPHTVEVTLLRSGTGKKLKTTTTIPAFCLKQLYIVRFYLGLTLYML